MAQHEPASASSHRPASLLQAVIFDFDGIIADTERLHYLAFERVLEPLGLGISWEAYVETCIGFDDRDVFRLRLRQAGEIPEPDRLRTLVAEKAQRFVDLVREEGAPVYPGVPELLRHLREQGVPVSLCSGALRSDIDAVIRGAGFEHCFDAVVTAEDVARSKPDPESYLKALQAMAALHPNRPLRAGTVVAIEDTPTGITAAKRAGLSVLAVTNTHAHGSLDEADAVVATLESLHVRDLARLLSPGSAAGD